MHEYNLTRTITVWIWVVHWQEWWLSKLKIEGRAKISCQHKGGGAKSFGEKLWIKNGRFEAFQNNLTSGFENWLNSKQEGQRICVFPVFFRRGRRYNWFLGPVKMAFPLKLPTMVGEPFLRLLNCLDMQFWRNFYHFPAYRTLDTPNYRRIPISYHSFT